MSHERETPLPRLQAQARAAFDRADGERRYRAVSAPRTTEESALCVQVSRMSGWEMVMYCAGIVTVLVFAFSVLHVIAEWLGFDLDGHYELEWHDDELG